MQKGPAPAWPAARLPLFLRRGPALRPWISREKRGYTGVLWLGILLRAPAMMAVHHFVAKLKHDCRNHRDKPGYYRHHGQSKPSENNIGGKHQQQQARHELSVRRARHVHIFHAGLGE